ncbi:hypothetical protein A0K93_07315 [Corynebacterium sp. BCW_4722]|nr:hypothetical protein A0K93_07315 [Corynebacterium sp. BCW_4722]
MYFDDLVNAVGFTFAVLDLLGVFLNALMGGLVARRMKFDAVGFVLLAIISGMAGGMMRDALLGETPATALQNPWYIGTALVGALVAFFIPLAGVAWELFRFHGDMIIVGVWAVTGTVTAIGADASWFGCVLMGVLTATGGMVIREVLIGQVPKILVDQQFYVVPAVAASISVQLFYAQGAESVGLVVSALVGFALGTGAYWAGWYVPGADSFTRIDEFFAGVKRQLADAAPRGLKRWGERHEQKWDSDPVSPRKAAPTRGDVVGELDEVAGDGVATQDEFLEALYRAYVDSTGSSTGDSNGRGVQ